MKARKSTLTAAELLRAAKAGNVDEMTAEDRQAWLNARGWSSPDYLRAELAARRAQHRQQGDPT